jgi:hypothetical protein
MASSSSEPSFVVLGNGWSVPLSAVQLLLELEGRGLSIRGDDDGGLVVGPRSRLTDADREAIRQHRDALRVLVAFSEGIQ